MIKKRSIKGGVGTTAKMSDVARRAGVSSATVSRTLTMPGAVNPETRDRVMAAVAELGYTPNAAARNLRVRRSMLVLVVVPILANQLFVAVISAIDRALSKAGYGLIIGDLTNYVDKGNHIIGLGSARHVDGIIAISLNGLPINQRLVPETNLPTVSAFTPLDTHNVPFVHCDDATGARLQVEHLLSLGHRRLFYISGWRTQYNDINRRLGMRLALSAAGEDPDAVICYDGDYSFASGVAAAKVYLGLPADRRPTGVLASSDYMALGFMKTVAQAGYRVPEDVSVVGYDGVAEGEYWLPTLTSIIQPTDQMGTETVRILLELMANPEHEVHPVKISPRLRVGGSTGPVKVT